VIRVDIVDEALLGGATGFFANGREHLRVLVEGVRLRLLARTAEAQADGRLPAGRDRWSGAFVTAETAAQPPAEPGPGPESGAAELLARLLEVQAVRERGARECGVPLPLDRVREAFGLDDVALSVLVLAVAAELSEAVRRQVAFLQDDLTRQVPDGSLAMALIGATPAEREAVRDALRLDAPLLRFRLLVPALPADPDRTSVLRMELVPARRVVELLMDDASVDPALAEVATLAPPQAPHREATRGLVLDDAARARIEQAVATFHAAVERGPLPELCPVLLLHGPEGTGKRTLAAAAAARLGLTALVVDCARLGADEALAWRLLREARLLGAMLVLHDAQAADPHLLRIIRSHEGPWAACVPGDEPPQLDLRPRPVVAIELQRPAYEARLALWRQALRRLPNADAVDLEALSARYRVTGGTILAVTHEMWGRGAEADARGLEAALAARSTARAGSLVERLVPGGDWEDLIVDDDIRDRLKLLVAQVRHGDRVFDEWGFGRLSSRRGVVALFHGPPGTGKTHAARIIARHLDLELLRIDVSQVVSKYIGETEKNLSAVLDEVGSSQAVLLFDEADSLFAARTAVRTSNDRYANQETSYLLQRIERYEGCVILTTNLESSIDVAFARRIAHRVHFPLPGPVERARLWRLLLPEAARGEGTIDFDALGRGYEVSGGHIANAVLRAAFLAAEEGVKVGAQHLARAANDEYQAMGKVVREL
jgi:SpoVK/Ycf46/Vps4 family AAA+-type ATPase